MYQPIAGEINFNFKEKGCLHVEESELSMHDVGSTSADSHNWWYPPFIEFNFIKIHNDFPHVTMNAENNLENSEKNTITLQWHNNI